MGVLRMEMVTMLRRSAAPTAFQIHTPRRGIRPAARSAAATSALAPVRMSQLSPS
jgi:hypothetical protein